MRIACLQFAPQVGDIDNNLNRADAVLSRANPQDLDLLVLPELAFTGYNFKSLQHISPYLEPTSAGITSLWARTTALKYDCIVTVGYPEKVDVAPKWPASPEYYNSAITVNAEGETIANYRKSFLYYTDETWALEGPAGFFDGHIEDLGNVAMGICKWPTKSQERMDLNPYKFESPWDAWEFSYHILHKKANLVILSMAWLTREDARAYSRSPKEPDMETLSYWLARLEPIIRAETEGEIIVVLANRCGTEGEAVYAGTSAVIGIHAGEVKVYGILGRGEKELLVVDTSKRPQAKLISEASSMVTSAREYRESRSSDPRTDSFVSEKSMKTSSTGLTINTQRTALTSPGPPTPDAMKLEADEDDDLIITPLSPVDASSPSQFFASASLPRMLKPSLPLREKSLLSSVQKTGEPIADSPTIFRPPSTKSRNVSRDRHQERALPLGSPDFLQELGRQRSASRGEISTSATPASQGVGTPSRHATNRSVSPAEVLVEKQDYYLDEIMEVVIGRSDSVLKESCPTQPLTVDALHTHDLVHQKTAKSKEVEKPESPPAIHAEEVITPPIIVKNNLSDSDLQKELSQLSDLETPTTGVQEPKAVSRLKQLLTPPNSASTVPIQLETRGLPNHLEEPQSALSPRPRSALW